jgi:hypothetical protein
MIFEARSMLNSPLLTLPDNLQTVPLTPEQVQRHYDQLQSEQEAEAERKEQLSHHLAAVREGSQEDMILLSPTKSRQQLLMMRVSGKAESVFDMTLLMAKTVSSSQMMQGDEAVSVKVK